MENSDTEYKTDSNPEDFIESNIIGTFNLLEAVRKYWQNLSSNEKLTFKFHHISTDEVFGSLGKFGKFDESSNYDPKSPYSASKASSDHLVNAWHNTYGIPISISNCSNNFGPFQNPEKLIPLVINSCLYNNLIPIYGDGMNIRDWLFVEDHIDAIFLILEKGKLGNCYCIGGYGERTNIEIVKFICNFFDKYKPQDKPHSKLIKFVDDRLGHDRRYAINPKLIEKELGWEPKHTLENGLEKTIKWYLSR